MIIKQIRKTPRRNGAKFPKLPSDYKPRSRKDKGRSRKRLREQF
jgi:hypothetical protein